MEYNEYKELIEDLARDRKHLRVPNGHPYHAAILMETMLNHAQAEVRIFTGTFSKEFYGQEGIVNAAWKFLSKPYTSLKILVQKPNQLDSHPIIAKVRQAEESGIPHGNIEVIEADGAYSKKDAKHFAVMDNDGFRFETDHSNCKAVANFNEPELADELILAFDRAFEIAKQKNPTLSIEQKKELKCFN